MTALTNFKADKEFLSYPTYLRTQKINGLKYYFYSKSNSFGGLDLSNNDFVVFAVYDDSQQQKENDWLVSVEFLLNQEVLNFFGWDGDEEAKKTIEEKWASFEAETFPKGLHFVKSKNYMSFYIAEKKAGEVVVKIHKATGNKFVEITVNKYNKNKFFFNTQERAEADYGKPHDNGSAFFEETLNGVKHTIPLTSKASALIHRAYDPERYEAEKEKALAAKIEKAREKADFIGLQNLEGTAKQIKWAEEIRARFIESATEKQLKKLAKLKRPGKAKWWIDNRSNVAGKLGA